MVETRKVYIDKRKVRCFNCSAYRHFTIECKKSKREKETKEEAHIVQISDEEPALLLAKHVKEHEEVMLINEDKMKPKLKSMENEVHMESNMWYLDDGASNHMTRQKSKFKKLDERVSGKVKFGNGSIVQIKENG